MYPSGGVNSSSLYSLRTLNSDSSNLIEEKLENTSDLKISQLISTHSQIDKLCLVEKRAFSAHSEFTNEGLKLIANTYWNLQSFSIVNAAGVTDEGVKMIARSCKNLRVLSISKCPKVTDEAIHVLANNNERLEVLRINREGEGFGFAFHGSVFDSDLNKSQCGMKLSERNVWFPALTHLELTNCEIINQDLDAISKLCPKLKFLKLNACKGLSEYKFLSILEKLIELETLCLNNNQNIQELTLDYSKFPKLQYSDINGIKIQKNKAL